MCLWASRSTEGTASTVGTGSIQSVEAARMMQIDQTAAAEAGTFAVGAGTVVAGAGTAAAEVGTAARCLGVAKREQQ
jgi:hypothetical protein